MTTARVADTTDIHALVAVYRRLYCTPFDIYVYRAMHHIASVPYCIYGGRRKNGTINSSGMGRAAATKTNPPPVEIHFTIS